MAGTYTRSPERGFRKFAMAFWDRPHTGLIYGTISVNVKKARQFQDDVAEKFGLRPSMGMLVGRGVACGLKAAPEGNAKIIWGQAYIKSTIDVYFQVDIGDGRDLSGVVVPDTGSKTIVEVAEKLRGRAKKLRTGDDEQYEKTQKGCLSWMPLWMMRRLLGVLTFMEYNLGITPSFLGAQPEPFGTVMVTNVSKFGIDVAYAPLVPPARVPIVVLVGQVEDRPQVEKGELCVRPTIALSATLDHRLLDGNKIGRFTRTVRAYMTNPYKFEPELGLEDPWPDPNEAKGAWEPEQPAKTEEAKAEDANTEDANTEDAEAKPE